MNSINTYPYNQNIVRSPAHDSLHKEFYNPPHSVVQKVSKVERKIFDRLKNERRPFDNFHKDIGKEKMP